MDDETDLMVNALARYLENSLEQEQSLREILSKAGYNDTSISLEDCLTSLVKDYLRLTTS